MQKAQLAGQRLKAVTVLSLFAGIDSLIVALKRQRIAIKKVSTMLHTCLPPQLTCFNILPLLIISHDPY